MPGYIKLYRDIQYNEIWQEKPFSPGQAWVDLLLMANHEDKKILFDGNLVEVKRGSFITSIRKLCEKWGWSNTKVVKFLTVLKTDEMIAYFSDKKKTLITIVNYGFYQDSNDDKTSQKHHRNDTETTLKHTNKNIKNEKNKKKDIYICAQHTTHKFIPPTLEEVKAYCQERKNNVDPQKWYDFYESKGWMIGKNKMKDWKAAVRTWERRDSSKQPQYKPQTQNRANFTQRKYTDEDYDKLYDN